MKKKGGHIMAIKDMDVGTSFKGKALCTKAEIIACSNGKNALFMEMQTRDDSFTAKQWDVGSGTTADTFSGKVVSIDGIVNVYKGVNEIKAYTVTATSDDAALYVRTLDLDSLARDFMGFLKTHISNEYYEALKIIFGSIDFEKFVRGYAATSHHDNVSGGLINHTLKMLNIAETVLKNLPELEFMKDNIYMGIVVHDIGKIDCYTSTGSVDTLNYVDHKALGIEKMAQLKLQLLKHISEDDYYQLLAIILGHHGEFGESCHTVATQIIHYIDMLDSQTTGLVQLMKQVNYSGDIKFDGRYLHI